MIAPECTDIATYANSLHTVPHHTKMCFSAQKKVGSPSIPSTNIPSICCGKPNTARSMSLRGAQRLRLNTQAARSVPLFTKALHDAEQNAKLAERCEIPVHTLRRGTAPR